MTREEAERLGMNVEHGGYNKDVPMDELEIFEERQDWDIQRLLADYEESDEDSE